MSGIDRMRGMAHVWNNAELRSIADQIERELREERDRWDEELCEAQMDKTRVTAVYLEINKHVSGVEGAEDSPVARWARELRDALKSDVSDANDEQNPSCADPSDAADVTSDAAKVTRGPAEDVSMSAYDLLPEDDREAIAWVREHDGLDAVRASVEQGIREHGYLCDIASMLGTSIYDGTDNADALLGKLCKRLMPEGMEWPRFEDDAPVRIGDEISYRNEGGVVNSIELQDGGYFILHAADGAEDWIHPQYFPGERVKRPEPKVLDADGVEIRVGDTVYGTKDMSYQVTELCEYEPSIVHAKAIDGNECGEEFIAGNPRINSMQLKADKLTHRAPVLAADGKPLREGEHVWHVETGTELVIKELPKPGEYQAVVVFAPPASHLTSFDPDQLTHERPDSWGRLEEDAGKSPCDYFGFNEDETCGKCPASAKNCEQTMARDIVRRCRALAERDR